MPDVMPLCYKDRKRSDIMKDVPLIPLEVFFGDPRVTNVKISPDGRFISYVAPLNGVKNIWVQDIKTNEKWSVTRETGRGIL